MQQPGVLNYPKTYRSPENSLLSPLFAAHTFTMRRHKPGRRFSALYDITTNLFPTLCALVDTFSRQFNWLTWDTLLQNHVKSTFASLETFKHHHRQHLLPSDWAPVGLQWRPGRQGTARRTGDYSLGQVEAHNRQETESNRQATTRKACRTLVDLWRLLQNGKMPIYSRNRPQKWQDTNVFPPIRRRIKVVVSGGVEAASLEMNNGRGGVLKRYAKPRGKYKSLERSSVVRLKFLFYHEYIILAVTWHSF